MDVVTVLHILDDLFLLLLDWKMGKLRENGKTVQKINLTKYLQNLQIHRRIPYRCRRQLVGVVRLGRPRKNNF